MSYLEIAGGKPLYGEIRVQGSKNAALPILAACVLGEDTCVIENCPEIGDVEDSFAIMRLLGCRVWREEGRVFVDASCAEGFDTNGAQAARIRSSILFLGALLGKMRKAVLPLPGGCAIGKRPIDLHLAALRQLGAEFALEDTVTASAKQLRGCRIRLPMPSVGATENVILASVQATGETVIENAAREPEIDELCEFLRLRGAQIGRMKNGTIWITGVEKLHSAVYRVGADRIAAGTYLLGAAAAGGSIRITDIRPESLMPLTDVLVAMGAKVRLLEDAAVVEARGRPKAVPLLETSPFPGLPTDLQSQLMAVLCRAEGKSCIRETIFENRFRTAEELRKMGAQIQVDGQRAWIDGVPALHPADLRVPDLRGGAALVIAALQAEGRSVIRQTEYIERGYENIVRDFGLLGADIGYGLQEESTDIFIH